jgi:hypothetical protein
MVFGIDGVPRAAFDFAMTFPQLGQNWASLGQWVRSGFPNRLGLHGPLPAPESC